MLLIKLIGEIKNVETFCRLLQPAAVLKPEFSASFYKKHTGLHLIMKLSQTCHFVKPLKINLFFFTATYRKVKWLQACWSSVCLPLSLSGWLRIWFGRACRPWLCSAGFHGLALASEHTNACFALSLPPSSCFYTRRSPSTQSFQPRLHRPWDCLPSLVNVKRD